MALAGLRPPLLERWGGCGDSAPDCLRPGVSLVPL